MSNDFPFELASFVRHTDPPTSQEAAASKKNRIRWQGQKHKLLLAFADHEDMTADEAGIATSLFGTTANYWKRCSELRAKGFIKDTGATRLSQSKEQQIVSTITQMGLAELADMGGER
jgi:hypothetical protein